MSCCQAPVTIPSTPVVWGSPQCPPPGGGCAAPVICTTPACSTWRDDRLAGLTQADQIQLLGRIGRSYYALAANAPGFVVARNGVHMVTNQPMTPLPPLRNLVPAECAGGYAQTFQTDSAGQPIENYPPPASYFLIHNPHGQWNSWRGPSGITGRVNWNGTGFVIGPAIVTQIEGPLAEADETSLIGSSEDACGANITLNRLKPNRGFVIGTGTVHQTLGCATTRPDLIPDESTIELYGFAACTSDGPMVWPTPLLGIPQFCAGKLRYLVPPKYTDADSTAGKIPTGKAVGDYKQGWSVTVGPDGCLTTSEVTAGDVVHLGTAQRVGSIRTEGDHAWDYGGLNIRIPFPSGTTGVTGTWTDYAVSAAGVPAGSKTVILRGQTMVDGIATAVGRASVGANGIWFCESWQNTATNFGYQSQGYFEALITDGKISVAIESEVGGTPTNTAAMLDIVGYRK